MWSSEVVAKCLPSLCITRNSDLCAIKKNKRRINSEKITDLKNAEHCSFFFVFFCHFLSQSQANRQIPLTSQTSGLLARLPATKQTGKQAVQLAVLGQTDWMADRQPFFGEKRELSLESKSWIRKQDISSLLYSTSDTCSFPCQTEVCRVES